MTHFASGFGFTRAGRSSGGGRSPDVAPAIVGGGESAAREAGQFHSGFHHAATDLMPVNASAVLCGGSEGANVTPREFFREDIVNPIISEDRCRLSGSANRACGQL